VSTGIADVVLQEIGEGLRVVRDNPIVRGITAVEALWQIVTAVLVVTLVVYTEETLRLGDDAARIYSLSVATLAAGTAVGAIVARPVERRIGRPWLMAIGYLAPLTLILAGFVPLLPVVFSCLAVLGFTDAWAVISMQTYLAEAVPDALRGRVYASWLGGVTLAQAIAFGLIGWVTARLGAPPTLALAGAIVGIGGPILLLLTGCVAAIRHEAKHTI
jgi:MFS family permease